jgi:hypothetical protein
VTITPEWVAVVLTLMGMSGGAGAWLQQQRHRARAAIPLIRPEWGASGEAGYAVKVHIVNRLNEDLLISRAECRTTFTLAEPNGYDMSKSEAKFTYTKAASPMALAWAIKANSEGEMTFRIDGPNTPRWLRLTVSSSSLTLRNRRLPVSE